MYRVEEIADAHLGTRHGRGGLCEQAQDELRAIERSSVDHRSMDDAGLHAAEHLEAGSGRLSRDLDRPLPACLGLERMSLVNDPVPHGRENPPVRGHVAEQQGVVGDDHVSARRPPSRAMEQTLVGEVRASAAEALPRRGGEHLPRHVAPADAQGVEVAVGRLTREGVGHGYGGEHVCRHRVGRPAVHGRQSDGKVVDDGPVETMEAGVVVIALEAVEREATGQDAGERGQLVRDELVGQGVRLCRDAHGQVVALGEEDLGEQIRYRLAHAGTGLDGSVGRRGKRVSHLGSHGNLLGPPLILPIHPRHGTAGKELFLNLRSRRHVKVRLALYRVLSWRVVSLGEKVVPRRLEREPSRALGSG